MKKLFIVFALIALCACGCKTAKKTTVETQTETKSERTTTVSTHSLTDTKWVLTHIYGATVMDSPETPYIIFMGDRVTGCLGCNTFFGTFFASKKGRLDLDYTGATKRLCNDMLVEKQFMSALKAEKKTYQIKSNILIVNGERQLDDGTIKNSEILRFKAEE